MIYHSPHTDNKQPRVTFVGTVEDGELKIAGARCSKKDQFNRKRGVHIATQRLQQNKLMFSVSLTGDEPVYHRFIEVCQNNLDILDKPDHFSNERLL